MVIMKIVKNGGSDRMKLFLIRHGESMQNTKENYQIGLPDHKVYLTKKGNDEAKDAGLFLLSYVNDHAIDLNSSAMWVSPYLRTRQTASIINESLKIAKVKEDYALIEQQYGLFSDKEENLFIVSHGTVLRTIVMNMMHYAPEWFNQEPNPGNCSIRLINAGDGENTQEYIYNPPKKHIKRYESQE